MYFNQGWEKLHGFETEFVKVFYYDFEKDFSDKYHSYAYHRICTIIDGEKIVNVGDKNFTYNQNEYVLLSPHSEVDMTMPVETKAMVLELSDHLIETVNKKVAQGHDHSIELKDNMILHSKMSGLLKQTMGSLNQTIDMADSDKRFLIDLAAQQLTYGLLKEEHSYNFLSNKLYDNPMAAAVELINNGGEEITVAYLAKKLYMSVPAFSNAFKKHYGISPNQYIRSFRMKKAMELLQKKTVGEVAFELGYQNVSYFIDVFKRYNNITPKQYQMRCIGNR